MIGSVLRKADRQHKEQVVSRAKTNDSAAWALINVAKAMLEARTRGTDPLIAVEQTIGWRGLEALVGEIDQTIGNTR